MFRGFCGGSEFSWSAAPHLCKPSCSPGDPSVQHLGSKALHPNDTDTPRCPLLLCELGGGGSSLSSARWWDAASGHALTQGKRLISAALLLTVSFTLTIPTCRITAIPTFLPLSLDSAASRLQLQALASLALSLAVPSFLPGHDSGHRTIQRKRKSRRRGR